MSPDSWMTRTERRDDLHLVKCTDLIYSSMSMTNAYTCVSHTTNSTCCLSYFFQLSFKNMYFSTFLGKYIGMIIYLLKYALPIHIFLVTYLFVLIIKLLSFFKMLFLWCIYLPSCIFYLFVFSCLKCFSHR